MQRGELREEPLRGVKRKHSCRFVNRSWMVVTSTCHHCESRSLLLISFVQIRNEIRTRGGKRNAGRISSSAKINNAQNNHTFLTTMATWHQLDTSTSAQRSIKQSRQRLLFEATLTAQRDTPKKASCLTSPLFYCDGFSCRICVAM